MLQSYEWLTDRLISPRPVRHMGVHSYFLFFLGGENELNWPSPIVSKSSRTVCLTLGGQARESFLMSEATLHPGVKEHALIFYSTFSICTLASH